MREREAFRVALPCPLLLHTGGDHWLTIASWGWYLGLQGKMFYSSLISMLIPVAIFIVQHRHFWDSISMVSPQIMLLKLVHVLIWNRCYILNIYLFFFFKLTVFLKLTVLLEMVLEAFLLQTSLCVICESWNYDNNSLEIILYSITIWVGCETNKWHALKHWPVNYFNLDWIVLKGKQINMCLYSLKLHTIPVVALCKIE